jgi:hypothetical protein
MAVRFDHRPEVARLSVRRLLPLTLALLPLVISAGLVFGRAAPGLGEPAPAPRSMSDKVSHDRDHGEADPPGRVFHYPEGPKQPHMPPSRRLVVPPPTSASTTVLVTGHLSAEGWQPPPGVRCPPTP